MKPETKLRKRRDKFIESLKELGYPFILAYSHTFDMENNPLQAYCHGAGRKCSDIDMLLNILGQSAWRNLGVGRPEMTQFTDSCSLRTGDPEPEVAPACVLEEECSS